MVPARRPPERPAPAAAAAPAARAAWWRDPWAALVPVFVLALAVATRSTPAGEPFADDFWFLDFSLLRGNPSWFDGGGGFYYWRPLARQAYYALFGPLMLSAPAVLAALHLAALGAAGVLVWRALRREWRSPFAAAAAAFPLGMEAARSLVSWPSGAQDLGALAFVSLAFFAVARGRGTWAALAAVAAALCKEVAAPLALLAAFAPFREPVNARRTRVRVGAALAAWAVVRVSLQPGLGGVPPVTPGAAGFAFVPRAVQAAWAAGLDAFGAGPGGRLVPGLVTLAAAIAVALWAARRRSDAEWVPWTAWGLAWFAAGIAPLALFWPDWAPFRSVLPALGLGVALVAPLARGSAAWLVPLVAGRLALVAFAPGATRSTSIAPPASRAGMDFAHLARVQRFMREARVALATGIPRPPAGASIVRVGMPRGLAYGFGEHRALRVWYRDTTLRLVPITEFERDPSMPLAGAVEFEADRPHEISLLPADALRALEVGRNALYDERWVDSFIEYRRAESLLVDTLACAFRAECAGGRAFALLQTGHATEAKVEARRALSHNGHEVMSKLVLGECALQEHRWERAWRFAESILADLPDQESALRLRALAARGLAATR